MLYHGFAAAEGAGHCRHASLGNGEQGINDPLSGNQGTVGRKFFLIGTATAHRPFLHQSDGNFRAVFVLYNCHGVGNVIVAIGDGLHLTHDSGGHHDFVEYYFRFLHGTQHIAAGDGITGFCGGNKVPQNIPLQRGHFHASLEAVAGNGHNGIQRTLDTVIDTADQTGAKLHAQRFAGRLHRFAGAKAGGFLIYLNGGVAPVNLDDFADEPLLADAHHVEHVGVAHSFGDDQRPGDLSDNTFAHSPLSFPGFMPGGTQNRFESVK